jgi:hypothetical protein
VWKFQKGPFVEIDATLSSHVETKHWEKTCIDIKKKDAMRSIVDHVQDHKKCQLYDFSFPSQAKPILIYRAVFFTKQLQEMQSSMVRNYAQK